ncbi:hypothetical protein Cob_v006041 [Colletotrichum orbiculare MAFF 240422]|uniref:Uncharacterized protein n=1 Tax=Colletotrichum orbiculare (strain 104-T / ATCC 96160 / CBS 514.97 / LARS 414 / MAFF 240422) TaxID=1213857 RepID=A0A484FT58_COLOR|nr:hypothetical protein Cob_v006041 [Colletotrichum orbiculare MAFF 240422]
MVAVQRRKGNGRHPNRGGQYSFRRHRDRPTTGSNARVTPVSWGGLGLMHGGKESLDAVEKDHKAIEQPPREDAEATIRHGKRTLSSDETPAYRASSPVGVEPRWLPDGDGCRSPDMELGRLWRSASDCQPRGLPEAKTNQPAMRPNEFPLQNRWSVSHLQTTSWLSDTSTNGYETQSMLSWLSTDDPKDFQGVKLTPPPTARPLPALRPTSGASMRFDHLSTKPPSPESQSKKTVDGQELVPVIHTKLAQGIRVLEHSLPGNQNISRVDFLAKRQKKLQALVVRVVFVSELHNITTSPMSPRT